MIKLLFYLLVVVRITGPEPAWVLSRVVRKFVHRHPVKSAVRQ